jgi:FSR family fosmidomycin resistance protein-like MFS transporter
MSADASAMRQDVRVIGLIGTGHAFSHFFQLVLAPLFPMMKADLGVSYEALGVTIAVFYTVSAIFQVFAGFAVDRFGARPVLFGGMALCIAGALIAGFSRNYEMLLVASVVGGLGNSVFHPSDFAILNARVNAARLGYAFSWHGVAGFMGYAAAPAFSVGVATLWGWQAAPIVAGMIGLAMLAGAFVMREDLRADPVPRTGAAGTGLSADLQVLFSMPVLMCFGYFVLVSVAFIAMQAFGVSTLVPLFNMPVTVASAALSMYLLASAVGVFTGGFVSSRFTRHNVVASVGVAVAAALILVLVLVPVPVAAVPVLLALTGFASGVTNPSRDLIVRQTTPPGSTGKVYGFVYSGIDVGSMIFPVIFGWMLDQHNPRGVLLTMVVAYVLTIATVLTLPMRKAVPQRA